MHNRLWGIIATLIFHAVVVVVLLFLYLDYPGHESVDDREWPPVDSSELLFGGEYVMVGDFGEEVAPEPQEASAPEPVAEASPTPPPAPTMASEQPSPMKTEKREKDNSKQKEQTEKKPSPVAKDNAKEDAEAAKRKEIQSKMGATFGASKASAAGQPDGNAKEGAVSGAPGHNLKGRTLEHFELPPRGPLGTVSVRVSVNRSGVVTSASYASGTGAAGGSSKVRANCVAAARHARFSSQPDAPASQTGTITFRFQ